MEHITGFFNDVTKFLQPLTIYRNSNRVNRIRYFATLCALAIIMGIIGASCIYIRYPLYTAIVGLIGIAAMLNLLILQIKRLHDIDLSGLWILIGFIPGIGVLFPLALMVLPGSSGDNRFALKPQKATRFEYIFAIICIPIYVILSGLFILAKLH